MVQFPLDLVADSKSPHRSSLGGAAVAAVAAGWGGAAMPDSRSKLEEFGITGAAGSLGDCMGVRLEAPGGGPGIRPPAPPGGGGRPILPKPPARPMGRPVFLVGWSSGPSSSPSPENNKN